MGEKRGMYLVYLDESHDENNFVVSALMIHETMWNDSFHHLKQFRKYLLDNYGIPSTKELHARDLAAGRGWLRPIGKVNRAKDIPKYQRWIIYENFISCIGDLSYYGGKCINACIPVRKGNADYFSVDRVLNRIQTYCRKNKDHALLIFDNGNEKFYRNIYRQMRVHNPIPSQYGSWGISGAYTKNITLDHVIGDTFFKESKSDYFIQAVDFIAFSLLKKEDINPPKWAKKSNIVSLFDKHLKDILVLEATSKDKQGIVRN